MSFIIDSKFRARIAFVCALLLALSSLTSCEPAHNHTPSVEYPSAKNLIYGVLQSGDYTSPDLLLGLGDTEYKERFESLYHHELSGIADGAVALSTGMSADEITVLRASEEDNSALITMLEDHVSEEISVFERYSPEDTANLKKACIFEESGFVVLIVSSSRDSIRDSLLGFMKSPDKLPTIPADTTGSPSGTTADPGKTDTETTAPETTADTPEDTTFIESSETTEPPDDETTAPVEPAVYPYAYENDIPRREPVGDDWFYDAVFIGDSRLDDLVYYLKPKCAADFTYTSLSVSAVFTKNLVETPDGKNITIADALKSCEFSKCYLMFGLNELGWPNANIFIKEYVKIIEYVRELNPDCEIYVMNMYPVTREHSDSHPDESNERIRSRNDLISAMAKEQGVHHLNAAAALCNENCELPSGTASDGVHGNKATCQKLFDYMHDHY